MCRHLCSASRVSRFVQPALIALLLAVALVGPWASRAQAVAIYWDGATNGVWTLNTNWSTASGAATPDPVSPPGASDDVTFNITTLNAARTIPLNGDQAALSLTFRNTNTTTLTAGGTDRTLTLGAGGITVNLGAGATTIGSATAGQKVNVALGASQTWTNNATATLTVTNVVSGSGLSLTKAGTGTVALNGANTFDGGLLVNNGTVSTTATAGFGAGTITLGDGTNSATLSTTANGTHANSNITVQAGSGTLTIKGGTNSQTFNGTVALNHDVTLANTTAAKTTTFSNTISNTSSANINIGDSTTTNAGVVALTGTNDFTGDAIILSGALRADFGTGLNSSKNNLQLNGGVWGSAASATTFTPSLGTAAGQFQWTDSGGFAAFGADMSVNINGNTTPDTLTWGTTTNFVASGKTLILGSSAADKLVTWTNPIDLGSADRTIQANRGTVAVATTKTVIDADISSIISGSGGGLSKTGGGILRLSGANTYTGKTTINAGTLVVNTSFNKGTDGPLGNTTGTNATIDLAGGTLQFQNSAPIGSDRDFNLTGSATISLNNTVANQKVTLSGNISSSAAGPVTLTINDPANDAIQVSNQSGEITGLISDGTSSVVTLNKGGKGLWTLSNDNNSFSGDTLSIVSNGTLAVTSIGNKGVTCAAGKGNKISTGGNTTTYTLSYVGTSPSTTDRDILFGPAGGTGYGGAKFSENGAGKITYNGGFSVTALGLRTLYLGGAGAGGGEFACVINNYNNDASTSTDYTQVQKDDAGIWTLSGANTYAGSTTINAGTLQFTTIENIGSTTANSLGKPASGRATINLNGGTLKYIGITTASSDRGFSLGGNGAIETTTNDLVLSGPIAPSAASTATKTLTLTGNGAGNGSQSGVIADYSPAAAVAKTGSNTWTLSGNNSYTGTTSVTAGTLKIGHNNGLGFGGATLVGGAGTTTASTNGTVDLAGFTVNEPITLNTGKLINSNMSTASTIESGVAYVVPAGTSATNLAVLTDKTVTFDSGSASAAISLKATQSTFGITGGANWVTGNYVTITGGGATSPAVYSVTAPSGAITGLTLVSGGAGYTNLTGLAFVGSRGTDAAPFGGTGGTLASTDNTFAVQGIAVTNAGSGYTAAPTATLPGGTGLTSATAKLSAVALTGTANEIGGDGNLTIKAVIGGTGGFSKAGNGTLTLAGANTYTGPTSVTAGTLLVNGSLAAGSAVTVTGGTLGGSGTIGGAVSIQSGATLAPGNSPNTLTINSTLSLAAGSLSSFEVDPATVDSGSVYKSDRVAGLASTPTFAGTLSVSKFGGGSFAAGQVFDLFDWSGPAATTSFSSVALPALAGGLAWKSFGGSQLDYATGRIEVISVGPATRTWNGGSGPSGDDNWTNPDNWDAGIAPSSGEHLVFDGATRLTPYNNTASGSQYASLRFDSAAGAFTLGGNQIKVAGPITNGSSNRQTIDLPVQLTSGGGVIDAAAGDIEISGKLTGSVGLTKNGSGELLLSDPTTAYTGDTTVNDGRLTIVAGIDGAGTGIGNLTVNTGAAANTEVFADHIRQTSLTIHDKGKVTITGGGASGTSVIGSLSIALPGGGAGSLGAAAVPEPGTLVLLAIAGLLGLLGWPRRQ